MRRILRANTTCRISLLVVLLFLCGGQAANATVTWLPSISWLTQRQLTLRVGNVSAVNQVTFNVTNAPGSQGVNVTGASNDTSATTPNGVRFFIEVQNNNIVLPATTSLQLTADSSAGLTCQSTSCGSVIIPFSKIQWKSYQKETSVAYAGRDLQDGTFNGSGTQILIVPWVFSSYSFTPYSEGNGIRIQNDLVFTYINDTIYPAGKYSGRIVYTAATF